MGSPDLQNITHTIHGDEDGGGDDDIDVDLVDFTLEGEDFTLVDAVLLDLIQFAYEGGSSLGQFLEENVEWDQDNRGACIRFLQNHGSRLSHDCWFYILDGCGEEHFGKEHFATFFSRLHLNLEQFDLTDYRTIPEWFEPWFGGPVLYTSFFSMLLTGHARYAGGSEHLLSELRPLIAAGMSISPFDGRPGPPDLAPQKVELNGRAVNAVIDILWPIDVDPSSDDDSIEDFFLEVVDLEPQYSRWPRNELEAFRRELALEIPSARQQYNWTRRRDILRGILEHEYHRHCHCYRNQPATGIAELMIALGQTKHAILRIVFSFI